ncbi:MAG: zinc-ribbon domain-containing protein [Chloroflexia bacterium]|nr:zinc-ribbon domain-containing protein [Chloroflexia bacterium]
MLTCSNCGASVREGARFCTSCGTRLNDPVAADATGVWAAPTANDPDPAADDSTGGDTDSPSSGSALEPAEPATGADDEPATRADATATTGEGFTWSWGASPAADARDEPEATDQVDEESGVVLEEAETTDPESDSGELVDATEIDILEPDETDTDATPVDEPAPETSDTMLVVEDDGDGETKAESETLAAWAEQWDSPEPEDDSAMIGSNTDPEGGETAEASSATEDVEADSGADRPRDDDEEEDTVTKAERLIGELRAMIPSLVRPVPPIAGIAPDSSGIADELEGAARSGQFDDIRETLLSAREHPRDVDTMINLTGKIDRLLELLDDRDNLVQTAERAATRLRPGSDASTM